MIQTLKKQNRIFICQKKMPEGQDLTTFNVSLSPNRRVLSYIRKPSKTTCSQKSPPTASASLKLIIIYRPQIRASIQKGKCKSMETKPYLDSIKSMQLCNSNTNAIDSDSRSNNIEMNKNETENMPLITDSFLSKFRSISIQ
jgi:hypothetical protein